MRNLSTKITQTSIKINEKLYFLKFGMVKLFETYTHHFKCEKNIFQTKIFALINLFLFIIYSFIKST